RLNFLPAELVARWTETARELERVTTPARAVERYEEALTQLDALRAESKREAATNAPEQVAAREALELLSRSLEEAARATRTLIEYLMPLLVMRDYERTLLDETYHAIVARQIEYGSERRIPWGFSEAAYNARDLHLNYQYGPFGVPGLGLKRGLSEDLVIAPYAT